MLEAPKRTKNPLLQRVFVPHNVASFRQGRQKNNTLWVISKQVCVFNIRSPK
jgi:hypothetical protein